MTKLSRLIFWLPRALSIIFILFLSLFSLDVFGNGYNFWQTVQALLIHNIPSIVLLIILLVAWKYELVGTIIYALFGILYFVLVLKTILNNGFEWFYLSWVFSISGPAFLVALLFFIGWLKKKKIN